jgi:hypothetical protein
VLYKTAILHLVLYECETWSHTLGEGPILRVFESRMLGIFELKGDKVAEGWRKLHSEELCILYSSPNIVTMIKSKRMRWTWCRGHAEFPLEGLKGRDNLLEVLGALWRIILKWIQGSRVWGCGLDSYGVG